MGRCVRPDDGLVKFHVPAEKIEWICLKADISHPIAELYYLRDFCTAGMLAGQFPGESFERSQYNQIFAHLF